MRAEDIPTVDIAALVDPAATAADREAVGGHIVEACASVGFLRLVGHGVPDELRARLLAAAEAFFALEDDEKERIAMPRGGRAWRGWFPLDGELTSGEADAKEGVYFGTDLPDDHPAVRAGRPLHGPNLYPRRPAELAEIVPTWTDAVADVGRAVLSGVALGWGLEADWFDRWCAEPTVMFRMFHYPPAPDAADAAGWGVGEHTDYGLLTLLVTDHTGGLEVRVGDRWVQVPPDPTAIVCNLGDMMERVTGGRFRSTPHRVTRPTRHRYSFPLFLDPAWDAELSELPAPAQGRSLLAPTHSTRAPRWDGADPLAVRGPYGEYLLAKVSKVFPELFEAAVGDAAIGDAAVGDAVVGDAPTGTPLSDPRRR